MKASHPSDVLLLENPIWHALSTEQAHLAQGNTLAKRFPREVAPFAAMPDQSASAYQALEQTLTGDIAALFLDTRPILPPHWLMVTSGEMYQMVFDAPLPVQPNQVMRKLSPADVPEMLALTKLTEPGPFLPRTLLLGDYFGIHQSGSLVAMAGERLHLTGYTEVSAVCTHPDFRGRGYGNALMSAVIAGILNRGETPFLHVRTENPAVNLYRKLGFQVRAQLYLAVIKSALPSPVTINNEHARCKEQPRRGGCRRPPHPASLPERYDPAEIEARWQQRWDADPASIAPNRRTAASPSTTCLRCCPIRRVSCTSAMYATTPLGTRWRVTCGCRVTTSSIPWAGTRLASRQKMQRSRIKPRPASGPCRTSATCGGSLAAWASAMTGRPKSLPVCPITTAGRSGSFCACWSAVSPFASRAR